MNLSRLNKILVMNNLIKDIKKRILLFVGRDTIFFLIFAFERMIRQ